MGFYLDSKVDYDDGDGVATNAAYYIGDKSNPDNKLTFDLGKNVNIPVYVQAVQTAGFADAATAFTEAFKSSVPWGGTLPPTSAPSATPTPGPTVDTNNLPTLQPVDTVKKEYEINNAAELYSFANMVNSGNDFSGKTVKLTADISLSDKQNWTPIGTSDQQKNQNFAGTFDGNGKTIYHMTIDGDYSVGQNVNVFPGLFGKLFGKVENLNIAGATINIGTTNSSCYGGFIAGYFCSDSSSIENCSVTDSTLKCENTNTSGGNVSIGGIVGNIETGKGVSDSRLDNCSVRNCTIEGKGSTADSGGCQTSVGGIAGFVSSNNKLNGCTVSKCTLKSDGRANGCKAGGIVGNVSIFLYQVTLTDCKVTDGCEIYGTAENLTGTIAGNVSDTRNNLWSCDETNTVENTAAYYRSGESYTQITAPNPYNPYS